VTAIDVVARTDGPADAAPVVLANSLGATTAMWEPQVAALADRYRVVRFDARGHGFSPVPAGPYSIDDLADDLVQLLDRMEIERAHLVGLSIGGMTALRMAARNPDRVDRLVVASTSAMLGPATMWAERAAAVRSRGLDAVADGVVDRWFTDRFRSENPGVVDWAREMLVSNPPYGYAECCGVIERMDLRGDLAAVRAPLLALAGAEDPATPPGHLRAIADGVARGMVLVVDRAAHLANLEQPEIVNRLILNHLERAEPPG
jgi:3-oxoadipate enol-lactonase